MALETATYLSELVATNPVGASDPKSQGDEHLRLIKAALQATTPGMAGRAWRRQSKTSAYTVVLGDTTSVISATGTWTLSVTAAATLGNGFMCFVYNAGTGIITIDPNAAETINTAATLDIQPGQWCLLSCDGTALNALLLDRASRLNIGTASGSSAYTVTMSPPILQLVQGQLFWVLFTSANTTTTPTLTVDSNAAKNILRVGGVGLSVGEIPAGHLGLVYYDGTSIIILNPVVVDVGAVMGRIYAHQNFF